MARYHNRLPKAEVEKIFYKLCFAICEMKNTQEAAEFLRDLLSFQEAEMIAKRLKIADLILKNKSYTEIMEQLKVSPGTIAKVQEWLKISGEGYRRAIMRTGRTGVPINNKNDKCIGWGTLKKKYPAYYWPELLLENMIKTAGIRQREKIRSALREMAKAKEKTRLYRRLNKMLITPLLLFSTVLYFLLQSDILTSIS